LWFERIRRQMLRVAEINSRETVHLESRQPATFASWHRIPRRRDFCFSHAMDVRAVLLALRIVGHALTPRGRRGGIKTRALTSFVELPPAPAYEASP